jgi:hypothetical protein
MKNAAMKTLSYIPGKGRGTLPVCDDRMHPNLITIYLDAQYDYNHNRLYQIGARVTAARGGEHDGVRTMTRWCEGPPDTAEAEREMLTTFAQSILAAVKDKATPNSTGDRQAPLHIVTWNHYTWHLLLESLARHCDSLVSAVPALYDLLTQKAAFASPTVTFLDEELRRKNLPILCPSLQNVATLLGFQWKTKAGDDLRRIFHTRVFDGTGRFGEQYYTAHARFDSQLPLEYMYAAWDVLPLPDDEVKSAQKERRDPYKPYRQATPELLGELMLARVRALDWIASSFYKGAFRGNHKIIKPSFDLDYLDGYREETGTLAQAVDDFLYIDRHTELAEWRNKRLAEPEQRVLAGDSLLLTYHDVDQPLTDEGADANAPAGDRPTRLKANTRLRLRVMPQVIGMDAENALDLFGAQVGNRLILAPRWAENTGWDDDAPLLRAAPTPDQLLYSARVEIIEIESASRVIGQPLFITAEVRGCGQSDGCFMFGAGLASPLRDGESYTLEPDPNSPLGKWQSDLAQELCRMEKDDLERGGIVPRHHVFYERLTGENIDGPERRSHWDENAQAGQMGFMRGLTAMGQAGLLPDLLGEEMELAKRDLIKRFGEAPLLLVQGPPGTGKTTATALAILARVQGALAAGLPCRVLLSCKTHAATDVLLGKVLELQDRLWGVRDRYPELFSRHFKPLLLTVPLLRLSPQTDPLPGIESLVKEHNKRRGRNPCNWDVVRGHSCCIAAGTPGGIYQMVKGRWDNDLSGKGLCDLLVIDEASQLSLPEALLAALPLRRSGQVIVVGDPRQMPPIVAHDWEKEPRRACQKFNAFRSLYEFLAARDVPQIKLERSFRVHRDMAEFLRREVYQQDSIAFYSTNTDQFNPSQLMQMTHQDPFLTAVLDPAQPLVVVEHDEAASQTRNPFEQKLMSPIITALTDPFGGRLDAQHGIGVVVPHRSQRAALRSEFPGIASAIDTVERYQGGEREVILVGVTESDPAYLKARAEFLLNPNRAVVALSRAKKKTVVIASRSVFSLHTLDEDIFQAACLWKNLRRVACPDLLWQGEVDGHRVTVWGKAAKEG